MAMIKTHKIWTPEGNDERAKILRRLGLYGARWFSCYRLKELKQYIPDIK